MDGFVEVRGWGVGLCADVCGADLVDGGREAEREAGDRGVVVRWLLERVLAEGTGHIGEVGEGREAAWAGVRCVS